MNWNTLQDSAQLQHIKEESAQQTVLIFKHSTTCSISRATLDRLERNWKEEEMKNLKPYYLDLLSFRTISNEIANTFNVQHESPQVLVIKNGAVIYHNSHFGIDYKSLLPFAKN
ncbi:MAG: bacillithiol system redox-active protein YtxJ [Cytophagia bacterium]|nr:bacillithiol system redox-active protein YtxJ [Cytophagia bacterium]NBW35702.1 bacillithiol system redox-active protein YtxJ [Cytophagia bacterium]